MKDNIGTIPDVLCRRCLLIVLMIWAALIQCRRYDLIIGRSAYQPHQSPALAGWGRNLGDDTKEGEQLKYRGVYVIDPSGRTGRVRGFDRRRGWSYLLLTETIPVEEGALIAVTGRVVSVERPFTGISRTSRSSRLEPSDVEFLRDTGTVLERARREYARIRPGLQERLSLPGSKLILAEDPQWRVDWITGEEALVAAAHSFDLMYAAEAQFVFSLPDERLQRVYFTEWFKGE